MRLSLKFKLLLTWLLIGLGPLAAAAGVVWWISQDDLEKLAYGQLESLRAVKTARMSAYTGKVRAEADNLVRTAAALRVKAIENLEAVQVRNVAAIEALAQQWFIDIQAQRDRSIILPAMAGASGIRRRPGLGGQYRYEAYSPVSIPGLESGPPGPGEEPRAIPVRSGDGWGIRRRTGMMMPGPAAPRVPVGEGRVFRRSPGIKSLPSIGPAEGARRESLLRTPRSRRWWISKTGGVS